ncbi:MAG: flagellar biosynthetic protein FliQ [Alphaproteobacteria bacterium]|nr:MAG: flagellar biosynthetic protein FliQ [Alphaproteobacteria bacterium]
MNEGEVIALCRETLIVSAKLGGPLMLLGLVIGTLISILQTLTQIQEMTVSFVPKMIAIFGGALLMLPYMLATLSDFTHALAERMITGG